jgi:hypothetical protein
VGAKVTVRNTGWVEERNAPIDRRIVVAGYLAATLAAGFYGKTYISELSEVLPPGNSSAHSFASHAGSDGDRVDDLRSSCLAHSTRSKDYPWRCANTLGEYCAMSRTRIVQVGWTARSGQVNCRNLPKTKVVDFKSFRDASRSLPLSAAKGSA